MYYNYNNYNHYNHYNPYNHYHYTPDKKTALETGLTAEKKLLTKIARASEKAKHEFEEFEKRDLKVREDLKHNKAKIKKLLSKVGDEKNKVCRASFCFKYNFRLFDYIPRIISCPPASQK